MVLLMMDWCFSSLLNSMNISRTTAEHRRPILIRATLNYSKFKKCFLPTTRKRRESMHHRWVETKPFCSLDSATIDISKWTPMLTQCFILDRRQTNGTNSITYSPGKITRFRSSSMASWIQLSHFTLARILLQPVRDKKSYSAEQIH